MSSNDASKSAPSMSVRFWGVRGSIACPGPGTARYGGNTPCVEIRCGEHVLIFDAGTGIRPLGNTLVQSGNSNGFDILLSHCHIDHVVGLPFFAPLFAEDQRCPSLGGQSAADLQRRGRCPKAHELSALSASDRGVAGHASNSAISAPATRSTLRPGVTLRTAPLNHPGGATGYRIDHGGRSVAYITDVEIGDGPIDPALLALAKGVDLLILDTTYTDEELPSHVGWGHSSWQQGIRLADAARCRQAVPVPPRSRTRRQRSWTPIAAAAERSAARHDRRQRGPASRAS